MRLPRVRISVGTLILVVAVMAMNFGAVRLLYKAVENVHSFAPTLFMPLGFASGFLPLINVAMIGSLLYAARKLHLFRGGIEARSWPYPGGITYFSLHFLAIGTVVSILFPGVIRGYLETLKPLTNHALKGWSFLFNSEGDAFPWVVLECVVLGVAISGPALFVSWIGHLVARRCATTLPRRRFWAMTCLVSLGFAGVAFAIAVTPQPFEDEQDIDLAFQVVDKDSGRPIAAAFLIITNPFDVYDETPTPPRALTDIAGRAQLTGRFLTIGERSAFRTMGVFSPWGRWLEISAAGYQTVRVPLSEVMGLLADVEHLRLPKVALERGENPEATFRDLAGTYSTPSTGFGHQGFKIEPDGRFAWFSTGCTGVDQVAYGYLRREGESLVLVPAPRLCDEAGFDDEMMTTTRFRSIPWGDRLYLSTTDAKELQEFCRAVFRPKRAANLPERYPGYLRESDCEKPQTGMPRLPLNVWAKFLLAEMSLRNEEGRLRIALESFIPKNPRQGKFQATNLTISR